MDPSILLIIHGIGQMRYAQVRLEWIPVPDQVEDRLSPAGMTGGGMATCHLDIIPSL